MALEQDERRGHEVRPAVPRSGAGVGDAAGADQASPSRSCWASLRAARTTRCLAVTIASKLAAGADARRPSRTRSAWSARRRVGLRAGSPRENPVGEGSDAPRPPAPALSIARENRDSRGRSCVRRTTVHAVLRSATLRRCGCAPSSLSWIAGLTGWLSGSTRTCTGVWVGDRARREARMAWSAASGRQTACMSLGACAHVARSAHATRLRSARDRRWRRTQPWRCIGGSACVAATRPKRRASCRSPACAARG